MKLINKVELILENFEKCNLVCHNDCPLGQLYDYSCALQHFIVKKMMDAEAQTSQKKPDIQPEVVGV